VVDALWLHLSLLPISNIRTGGCPAWPLPRSPEGTFTIVAPRVYPDRKHTPGTRH
jgi:hypothetical protein